MLRHLMIVNLALLVSGSLMGCASAKPAPAMEAQVIRVPVPEIHNVYPVIPDTDLMCAAEPIVPADLTREVAADLWVNSVVDAGADCRSKLDTIRSLVNSWPK